jgi:hypothetical protein
LVTVEHHPMSNDSLWSTTTIALRLNILSHGFTIILWNHMHFMPPHAALVFPLACESECCLTAYVARTFKTMAMLNFC